jgi:hypothetical protein
MTSKLSPTVVIKSVTLTDSPIATVTAEIVDMDSFRLNDEELQQYIKAYCILSNSELEHWSQADQAETALSTEQHLTDSEWYKQESNLEWWSGQKISTDFNSNTCTFEIDIEDIVTPNGDGTSWSCSNMSFFAYVQIDAQQMASDYEITVPEMAGNYTTGVILEDNESVEGYGIVDMREHDDI